MFICRVLFTAMCRSMGLFIETGRIIKTVVKQLSSPNNVRIRFCGWLCSTVVSCHCQGLESGIADREFIPTESDISHVAEGVLAQMSEHSSVGSSSPVSFTDLDDSNLNMYASPISFEPASLDFRNQPLSVPIRRRVVVKNLSPESSIEMLSISGSTVHFHCSFFQEKRISPGADTSFDVVYLGRQEGLVENTLFIHTSLGSFKYQVSALGEENPYRLRPLVGARVPLNGTYTPLIYMHNPHSSTIQLTEIYSSGGDLHLEVPDEDSELSKDLWEIPPYETRAVMRANFVSRIEKNHTTYICIKTNDSVVGSLVLPVEVEVVSLPGIYSPTEVLDFGILHSEGEPKTLPISLLNSGQKHVQIMNVFVTPVNDAVEVKFLPTKVPPDTVRSTQVASVTYIPSRTKHAKQCSGKIVVKSKNNQHKLAIPFQVSFLNGSLSYNASSTVFYIGRAKSLSASDVRPLTVSNLFAVPVVVHGVELRPDARPHFTVIFNRTALLLPRETRSVAFLRFHPALEWLQLRSHLRLHTNVSHFDIPLSCYSGRLKVHLLHALNNETLLDFGTLGIGHKRSLLFAVINENPIEVVLKHWGSNLTKTYIELVGIEAGNASTLARRYNFSGLVKGLTLKPQHFAVFRVGVTAPETEGVFTGEVFLETKHEVLKVYFTLRTAKGSLTSDPVAFENAFPGKVSSQNLYIHSTFSQLMTVTSVYTIPEDPRFHFEVTANASPHLQPRSKNLAGKLYFDPRRDCGRKCYSGLPTRTAEGSRWLSRLSLPKDVGEVDLELFRGLRERWNELEESRENVINLTLKVDTSQAQSFLMRAQASLQWPRLSARCQLKFPVTQVGNLTVKEVALENPSNLPVLVQVLPLHLYPNTQAALAMAQSSCGGANVTEPQEPGIFTLQDLEEYDPSPDNVFLAYGKGLEEYFGVQPHRQSLAFQLTPGMRVRLRVGFSPTDDSAFSSLLLVRNNLTVMSTLLLKGQGGYGQMRLGNKTPGADSTLTFELNENHCKDCDGSKSGKIIQPNFTVRRAFTARNTGQLPVYVSGFSINDSPCEGYGFRVLNCYSFELKANSSKRIDIAFTPDFTLTRVERTLEVHTSLGPRPMTYRLVATVPRRFLGPCGKALPRPPWEGPVHWCLCTAAVFIILCAFAYAFLERDRILQESFYPLWVSPAEGHTFHPFDLRNVGGDTPKQSDKGGGKKQDAHHRQYRKSSPGMSDSITSVSGVSKQEAEYSNRNLRRRSSSSTAVKQKVEPAPPPPPATLPGVEAKKVARPEARNGVKERLKRWLASWYASKSAESKASVATQTAGSKDEERKSRKKKSPAEEETSSTTTETSTSDLSEKDHLLPDVCVSAKRSKSRRSKSKGRELGFSDVPSTVVAGAEEESVPPSVEDDGDFEVSTRSRSHRKVKVDPKKAFGGEILRPSSLELPYKPKSVSSKETEIRFRGRQGEGKMKSRSSSFENDSEQRKSSPPPVWDQPKPSAGTEEAFAEIAKQTERFALRHRDTRVGRPASYSAAVAGYGATADRCAIRDLGVVGQRPPGPQRTHAEPCVRFRPPQTRMDSLDSFSPEPREDVWQESAKQEIAPMLRNICTRPLDSFSTWSRVPYGEELSWSIEDWSVPRRGPTLAGNAPCPNRWGTEAETGDGSFGIASNLVRNSFWDPASRDVWGFNWWTAPTLSDSGQFVDTSPTESMANVVSMLGIDSPDADLPETGFSGAETRFGPELEEQGTPGPNSFGSNVWTQRSSRVTPIGQPWGYSLFQSGPFDARSTGAEPEERGRGRPLGWQEEGPA